MSDSGKNEASSRLRGRGQRERLSPLKKFFHAPGFAWFIFFVLVTSIALILSFHFERLPSTFQAGRVAPRDIKADRNYEIIDAQATEANRKKAFNSVLPVLDLDVQVQRELDKKIEEALHRARRSHETGSNPVLLREQLEKDLGFTLSRGIWQALSEVGFSEAGELQLRALLTAVYGQKIVASRGVLPSQGRGLTLKDIRRSPPDNETLIQDLEQIRSVQEVQAQLPQIAKALPAQGERGLNGIVLAEIAGPLILPNTTLNAVETDLRRARAVSSVPSVITKVQAGEAIIRGGDRYEPFHLTILQGIRKQKSETSFVTKFIGTVVFVSLLLLVTYFFANKYIRKFKGSPKDLYFLGGILVLLLLGVRLGAAFASALTDMVPFDVPVLAFYYGIPVAGGAMLVRYILNSETSLLFAIVASALSGMFLEADLDLSIYFMVSGIIAAYAMAKVDRRSQILRAGLITGVINAVMILAIKLITVVSLTEALNVAQVIFSAAMGLAGGILSSIFVLVMAPVSEMVFNYITDIKLLELGNLNHPLLKEMIVKAPGTYHHSQLVAVLSEAAASEIGANPLLARVGSYFHDIGKMRKPEYFIENQQGGLNRHDKLSPSMSALIIASHVKDGLEMAREYNLPQKIADFIPQHQGTKVITYFYKKAVEQSDGKEAVEEKHYRYPGPRPQTREAGIILLADGVEASVRSIPEKTPQRIQGQVQKIINNNFIEEQLDECDMTLRDLHKIAATFTRVLVGIYHQRIAYPEEEEKKATVTPLKNIAKTN
jgi:hypothetical protein